MAKFALTCVLIALVATVALAMPIQEELEKQTVLMRFNEKALADLTKVQTMTINRAALAKVQQQKPEVMTINAEALNRLNGNTKKDNVEVMQLNMEAIKVLNNKQISNAPNCDSYMQLIEQAEGYRACTYVDTTGHKTICYGFNLDAGGAKEKVERVGGNWDSVYNHGGCLTKNQCVELLQSEADAASASAESIFGSQCTCIHAVVTDMTYNLGSAGMRSFGTFISYIKAHNWSAAASDIRGTLWCRQVGNRCSRDASIIANGC